MVCGKNDEKSSVSEMTYTRERWCTTPDVVNADTNKSGL